LRKENLEFIESGQVLTIRLKGELDHHSADESRVLIDEKINEGKFNKMVIDFKNLDFIDSSGIGFIIGRYKVIRKRNGVIEIINAGKKVRKILDMSGIGKIIDIKTAVSEAVTNAVIHGYEDTVGEIEISCRIKGQTVEVIVEDFGCGILDVEKAKEPLYTTKPELERSGMGFAVMESYMDEVVVLSEKDVGTKVIMRKKISDR